ncbi:NUDIX hydrolase [Patescibacteria group bacterium]|nr:NUDIX hydrolase [Patescibacteria group bacterium]MBU2220255.1 NUDIX hydrolase [Patescibacteria group bacterium]MBU2264999.1 NUDIX hydrolase [Patescibacteria group bacterium]
MKQVLKKTHKFVIVAIDVVIFAIKDGILQVLLIKPKQPVFKKSWALPGGMVMPKESVDDAVKRHLFQKAGVSNVHLEQLYTFGSVNRDPFGRVVSVAHFALIPPDKRINLKTTEAYADIKWLRADNLPSLAYDHKEIIMTALERLRSKLAYTNIVYSLLPEQFTMSQMQQVYEVILDRKLDKRNFQKKIKVLNLIKKVGRQKRGEPNRPAELFTFISKKSQTVDVL